MKITAIAVKDFKRIKDVRITPDADRALILIGGSNGAGKSSTLDALTAAFGGKKALPPDPVRHGADAAEVIVQLDSGITIRRTISADGESTLEVRDEMGARKAPQQVLDGIVAGRFLDPLHFLAQPAKDQRAQLMKLIPDAERIATLDEKRERAYTKRTEVGRDLTKAKGELERLPVIAPGEPIDVAALTAESKQLADKQRAGDAYTAALREAEQNAHLARSEHGSVTHKIEDLEHQIAELKQRLEKARNALPSLEQAVEQREAQVVEAKAKVEAAAKERAALQPRIAEVDADLARADKHNSEVYSRRAHMERRTDAAASVEKLDKEVAELTKVIQTIDTRKAEILGAAKLPVDGLGIDAEGITLNGVPFIQASAAERLRVALGLAMAASPELGDVWIRDGALLDDESLELVAQQAAAAGRRCWIERVGTKDPGVIVIKDGQVAS